MTVILDENFAGAKYEMKTELTPSSYTFHPGSKVPYFPKAHSILCGTIPFYRRVNRRWQHD